MVCRESKEEGEREGEGGSGRMKKREEGGRWCVGRVRKRVRERERGGRRG